MRYAVLLVTLLAVLAAGCSSERERNQNRDRDRPKTDAKEKG